MNKKIKIIIALILGFVIAIIWMGIAIYFAYCQAYSTNIGALTVRVFGIPIYELTRTGTFYVGKAVGKYMGVLCLIFMVIGVFVEEIISKIKSKKRS